MSNPIEIMVKYFEFMIRATTLYPYLAKERITMVANTPFTHKEFGETDNPIGIAAYNLGREKALQNAREFMGKPLESLQKELNELDEIRNEFKEFAETMDEQQQKELRPVVMMMDDIMSLLDKEAKAIRDLSLQTIES